MQFQPTTEGVPFTVALGATVSLGRQPRFKLTNTRISRQHAQLTVQQQGDSIACICLAHRKVEVQREATIHAVQAGCQFQLLPGDILYLFREGSALKAGFQVAALGDSSTLQPKRKSSAETPASKRTRLDGSAAAAAAGTHGKLGVQQQQQTATATVAATQESSRLTHGSGGVADRQQIFAGTRLCVWDHSHTQQAVQLAARAGAQVQATLESSTTHVIAPFGLTYDQLQQQLQAAGGVEALRQQQQHQSPHKKEHGPAAASPIEAARARHGYTQQYSLRRLQLEETLAAAGPTAQEHSHSTAGSGTQQQQQQQCLNFSEQLLPAGVKFVTARWLTDSLAAGTLLSEDHYYIHLQRCQHQPPCIPPDSHPAAGLPRANVQPPGAAAQTDADAAPQMHLDAAAAAAAAAAKQLLFPDSQEHWAQGLPAAADQQQQQQQQQEGSSDDREGAAAGLTLRLSQEEHPAKTVSGEHGDGTPAVAGRQQQQQQRLQQLHRRQQGVKHMDKQQHSAAAAAAHDKTAQQQQQYANLVLPIPDQICRPGEPWGSGGRWLEPWVDDEARDAVNQLMAHWHSVKYTGRQREAVPAAAAAAAGGGEDYDGAAAGRVPSGDETDVDLRSSDDDLDGIAAGVSAHRRSDYSTRTAAAAAAAAAPPTNNVCGHAACSLQHFCFVHEMERVRGTYSKGRRDEFRIRAADRAIRALELLPSAITSPEDIHAMGLGPKTSEKLLELLNTGHVWRTEVLEGSEYNKVMDLFNSVWGVAESTAERWYQAGCRTLQDVRSKVSTLTAMQQVGLRYHQDFLQRIPRAEVAECEVLVTEAAADTLQDLSGKSCSDVLYLLHCRALGSYVRGKLECGDVDFIIAPGPACAAVCLGPLMAGILQRLAEQGYITQDMLPLERHKASRGAAERVSWMGVYKGPSSPCHRRLDIKLYPRCQLATAVNYFGSGQAMCRALRHWCSHPNAATSALAAALNPTANAFRLSDRELVVIHKVFTGKARRYELGSHAAAAAAAAGGEADDDTAHAVGRTATVTSAKVGSSRMGASGKSTTIRETVVGPAVKCDCETDIFKALGLAFVPMHMRNLVG